MIRLALVLTLLAGPTSAEYFYSSQTFAQKHCPKDQVVWLNATTHVYYFHNDPLYGMTQDSAYTCEHDADAAGDLPAGPDPGTGGGQ